MEEQGHRPNLGQSESLKAGKTKRRINGPVAAIAAIGIVGIIAFVYVLFYFIPPFVKNIAQMGLQTEIKK